MFGKIAIVSRLLLATAGCLYLTGCYVYNVYQNERIYGPGSPFNTSTDIQVGGAAKRDIVLSCSPETVNVKDLVYCLEDDGDYYSVDYNRGRSVCKERELRLVFQTTDIPYCKFVTARRFDLQSHDCMELIAEIYRSKYADADYFSPSRYRALMGRLRYRQNFELYGRVAIAYSDSFIVIRPRREDWTIQMFHDGGGARIHVYGANEMKELIALANRIHPVDCSPEEI